MECLQIDDAQIEYEVRGQGEPVLLIHLSVIADGLAYPLFGRPEIAAGYQLIHFHRRGYGASTLGTVPLTAAREAADAAALLGHLGIRRAHVVGHSFGGQIALQLAIDAPHLAHSLALLEPSLPAVPGGEARLQQLFAPMLEAYRAGDKRKATVTLSDAIFGPGWQSIVERAVPGSVEQAVKDFDTFIREQGPIQQWQFGPAQAPAIWQPVLSMLGVHTSPFMKAGRSLLHDWLPQAEDCDIGSTHLLQMQDPIAVANGLAAFFSRHPMR
ncbi:MAG: alpha/beta fold hydrolase [Bacteroidota bacterium]